MSADALALDLMSADPVAVKAAIEAIDVEQQSALDLDPSVSAALKAHDKDYEIASRAAEKTSDQSAKAEAIRRRNDIQAAQVTDRQNFLSACRSVIEWARAEGDQLARASYREAKTNIPKGVGLLAKGAPAAVVVIVFGWAAGLALVIPALRPDRDKAEKLKNEIEADTEKAPEAENDDGDVDV